MYYGGPTLREFIQPHGVTNLEKLNVVTDALVIYFPMYILRIRITSLRYVTIVPY